MIPKFRAWDRKLNEMYSSDEVVVQIKGQDVLVALEDSLHQIQDFSLMLSTGLYAKYQTEVFEGDIVQDTLDNEYGVIRIEEAQAVADWGGYIHPLFENVDTLEVVGNIYENQDLLGESDNEN